MTVTPPPGLFEDLAEDDQTEGEASDASVDSDVTDEDDKPEA